MRPITDVYIFTRDLRISDNEGIRCALQCAKECAGSVQCMFIFRKQQIGKENKYRSDNAIAFMLESLEDLEDQLHEYGGSLVYVYTSKALPSFHKWKTIQRVHIARDYTPFAEKRERDMRATLKKLAVELLVYDTHLATPDSLTVHPGKTPGKMYQTFAPFYDKIKRTVPEPKSLGLTRRRVVSDKLFARRRLKSLASIRRRLLCERISPDRIVTGGRECGLKILREASKRIRRGYDKQRHKLGYTTSHLSAYHHFGCISPRETWRAFSHVPVLRRQLAWRDYAYHMFYRWPKEWKSVSNISADIPWKRNASREKAWKEGMTGVPAVDAAMRQLRQEGYIHNRGRMIVANYLIKNLMIDWRVGERFFAQWLTDYDRAVNFMNWVQIAAFLPTEQATRTMNPYIQAKKNDPDNTYIQTYIPELKGVDGASKQNRSDPICDAKGAIVYPAPIVDYTESRKDYMRWAKKYLVKYKVTKGS